MILNQGYDKKIKFIETNQKYKSNFEHEFFESIVELAVILDNSEIHFYQIKNNIEIDNKLGNEVVIRNNFSFNVPGIECVCCKIIHDKDARDYKNHSFFFLSFKDGSMLYLTLRFFSDKNFECLCLKPKFDKVYQSGIELKFLDNFEDNILLLSENQYIYLMEVKKEESHLIKVCGTYTDGYFINKNVVVGITKGKLFQQIRINNHF
jgi:hypothetical protein